MTYSVKFIDFIQHQIDNQMLNKLQPIFIIPNSNKLQHGIITKIKQKEITTTINLQVKLVPSTSHIILLFG